jgi:uncharacterized phiE125 gp8 family phage protein
MIWTITTPPATEPVTYAQMKSHLHLDDDNDRDYIIGLISAAREYAENSIQRSLITRTITAKWYNNDPVVGKLILPRGPVQSITQVTNFNGVVASVGDYELRRDGANDYMFMIRTSFPFTIVYQAGYGDATAVPPSIKTGIMMHVAHLFRTREAISDRPQNHVALGLSAIYNQFMAGPML